MKKKAVILIISIIIIIGLSTLIFLNKKAQKEDELKNNSSSNEQEQVDELKEQLGITGDSDIYTVSEEYDGRETLTIKPNAQFSSVMAGVLKQDRPEDSEIEELVKNMPNGTGIWVSENSKEKFLEILKTVTKNKYTIDENGFLVQEKILETNNYDKKIKKIISSNKLYMIDINSKCYILDEVTGKVVEYPFEEMDPYTPFEYFESENKTIFVITKNNSKKLKYEDIIIEILENINL